MAIAMDATSLGDRFVVLAISVVYRGCAVPVAWKVLKAEEKHAWKPEWQALLKRFQGLLPEGWTVIVLADRGLYAKWLFEAIVELKWHPFLRVNTGGLFRREGWYHWQPFSGLVPAKGRRWQGRGTAFRGKDSQLRCTLLGYWGEEHQDPWLVLTDLAPECADACWYGLRAWIERKRESQPPAAPCWGATAQRYQSPTLSSCILPSSTGRANGSSSSIRLLGQVGNFSKVSLSHAAGSIPLSFAVPSSV